MTVVSHYSTGDMSNSALAEELLKINAGTLGTYGKEEYDNGFEAEIIEQETFRIVRKAVEELPTQMRNIILYSMKGLKNHEIADKLQISEGTVHTLKKFAYRKLRESLKGINYTLLLFLCK